MKWKEIYIEAWVIVVAYKIPFRSFVKSRSLTAATRCDTYSARGLYFCK